MYFHSIHLNAYCQELTKDDLGNILKPEQRRWLQKKNKTPFANGEAWVEMTRCRRLWREDARMRQTQAPSFQIKEPSGLFLLTKIK
jgi:hypothetical protein